MILNESLKALLKETINHPTNMLVVLGSAETKEEREVLDFIMECKTEKKDELVCPCHGWAETWGIPRSEYEANLAKHEADRA